jgi:hypothetical protein
MNRERCFFFFAKTKERKSLGHLGLRMSDDNEMSLSAKMMAN